MKIIAIKASDTLSLRNTILRPDFSLEQCNYPGDSDVSTHHLGCIINKELVGIVSIYKITNSTAHSGCGFQIRAMATCETVRNKGIGIKLLKAAEEIALKSGANYLWANARVTAIGFYKKAGYKTDGKEFQIEGIGAHVVVCRSYD